MCKGKYKFEKRRYPRVKRNIPLKLENNDFDIVTETKNISCTGAYCLIDRYLPVLTKIKTRILLPSRIKNKDQHIDCNGVVVRIEKNNNNLENQYNIAIYFNEISKKNTLLINRFIKQQTEINTSS